MSDHTIKDGKIVPNEPAQFEYGERYVMCRWCGTKRPVSRLRIDNDGDPACADEDTAFCNRTLSERYSEKDAW